MNIKALISESIKHKCIFTALFLWIFRKKLQGISKNSETEKSGTRKKSPFVYNLR